MKIVILDGYTENPGDLSWEEMEKLGELTVYDRTPVSDQMEIIRRIGDAEIVIVNLGQQLAHQRIEHALHRRQ